MSQTPWRRYLAVAAVALLLTGVAVAYHLWTRCPIQYDRFEQIADGMHLSEVEKLLECPPGDYRRGEIVYTLDTLDELRLHTDSEEARWQGDQGDLMIFHDHNKIILGKTWMRGEPEPWVHTAMIWFVERIRDK